MKIEDLSLVRIDGMAHLTISHDLVAAAAFAARAGYGDVTARRFVTALVMTDKLKGRDRRAWGEVLKAVANLVIEGEIAALEDGRVISGELNGEQ